MLCLQQILLCVLKVEHFVQQYKKHAYVHTISILNYQIIFKWSNSYFFVKHYIMQMVINTPLFFSV